MYVCMYTYVCVCVRACVRTSGRTDGWEDGWDSAFFNIATGRHSCRPVKKIGRLVKEILHHWVPRLFQGEYHGSYAWLGTTFPIQY